MATNQTKSCSNISGKVRIVARIRGFRDQELSSDAACSTSVISVRKSVGEKVTLTFDDQTSSRKNPYEVDHCYQQNEDTALIFAREIKPQISRVFDGENATFIAFGARGSGKTYTIQGFKENLGLGMLAMDEILKIAEEERHRVAVSIYEVFQDHVYDLLDSKNPEVQVLEDAQGKIMLKGLSKVPVKSMLEFQKLYYSENSSIKPTQKTTLELPRRSHKALMIHILTFDDGSNFKRVGKMSFVDLAGYENARRNSIDGTNLVEGTRVNKSLNALFNVIHAINANESRVPYRESKLARVLQDSLGGNNHVLMLVCLNPLFCPDTIHAITVASRLKNVKPVALCSTAKKQTNSRLPSSAKNTNTMLKGRKLFGDAEQSSGFKRQILSMANDSSNTVKSEISNDDSSGVPYGKQEEKCSLDGELFKSDVADLASAIVPCSLEEESLVPFATQEMGSIVTKKEDGLIKTEKVNLVVYGDDGGKENNSLVVNEGQSTPSIVRLKKISDCLKSLSSSTPLLVSRLPNTNTHSEEGTCVDTIEPKTPILSNKLDLSNFESPSGTFNKRSSGLKQSLIEDYLQFLNTANKEDLKKIKGIGEKRASYILELREESPQPFKSLDDLQEIGLSAKQVKGMMKSVAGELFR